MVQLAKFDAQFSITITSKESVSVTKEIEERVRKTLQHWLNESEFKRKIELRFELSQMCDVQCEVSELIVDAQK